MSIHDHEFSGLNWVKGEIEESLNQTRQALEQFVEDPNDVTQLRFCVTYLHQIRGTLQIIELYGAELLAEEMEYVAQALLDNKVPQRDDALEVLMRAILQMPNYLERLQAGHHDIPIILLPLLNDLRASRGQSLLSENVLFSPDLSVATPAHEKPSVDQGEVAPLRKLRQIYQTSLVAWYRDSQNNKALQHMSSVVEQIERQLDESKTQVWWVARGLFEAITDKSLPLSISVKTLLGQIDREIKHLIDTGIENTSNKNASDLTKNILFYIGQSTGSSPLVTAIKEAFQLDELLPDEDQADELRGSLSSLDSNLLNTVSAALQEELLKIKEALDLYVRNPEASVVNLESMEQNLRQVGDTLGMLGQGVLRSQITQQADAIHQLIEDHANVDDTSLMKVASTLLSVESSLATLATPQMIDHGDDESTESIIEDAEYHLLMQEVIKEAMQDISDVKKAVIEFSDSPRKFDLLNDIPKLLSQVKGGLLILGISQPVQLLLEASEFIQQILLEQHTPLNSDQTDQLADAITSIEYYLESLAERRAKRPEILAFGQHSLDALKRGLEAHLQTATEQPAAAVEAPAPVASYEKDEDLDDMDEVFIEEAEEELESITQQLQRWENNHDDKDALTILRRSFHTLKGSGRLIGASEIGEFAWGIEGMLNKVIDGAVAPSASMFSLLHNCVEVLPTLISAFRDKVNHTVPLSEIATQAEALTQGLIPSIASVPTPTTVAVAEDTTEVEVAEPEVIELEAVEPETIEPEAEIMLEAIEPEIPEAKVEIAEEREPVETLEEQSIETSEVTPQEVTIAVEQMLTPEEQEAQDELDEVVAIFLEEADELLQQIDAIVHENLNNPQPGAWIEELQRHLHTLKGSARMANVAQIGDFSHSLESLLTATCEGQIKITQPIMGFLQHAHDQLLSMVESVQSKLIPASAETLIAQVEEWLSAPETLPTEEAPAAVEPIGEVVVAETAEVAPSTEEERLENVIPDVAKAAPVAAVAAAPSETIRMRAETLDKLVNDSAEIGIFKSRISQQLNTARYNLSELQQTINRVHHQMRQLEIESEAQMQHRSATLSIDSYEEFDPLEFDRFSQIHQLSRSLMEGVSDLENIYKMLQNQVRDTEVLFEQQHRKHGEIHTNLMQTRLVPFSSIIPRLRRIVRQTADTLGKQVEFNVINEHLEMDRSVLNRILPAFEHLLRNAIDHGIESPQQRGKQGKNQTGAITLSLSQLSNQIIVELKDDGSGIDVEQVKQKAMQQGLLSDADALTRVDIIQYILESGFTTAEEVTQISGRGVGLDVVNTEVKQVGGFITIDSTPQQGTCFTITLPLTLATQHVLMARIDNATYALPLTGFLGIARISSEEYQQLLESEVPTLTQGGREYRILSLDKILGSSNNTSYLKRKNVPLLLFGLNDHYVALHADTLNGHHEIVMKPLGPQANSVQEICGGTIMGDGSVVLIIDLATIVRVHLANQGQRLIPSLVDEQKPLQEQKLLVMVVDDSLTVRKVTSRFIERNDMEAVTARDGFDAVEKLESYIPDIILLDVEMPRMDGFEFATFVRNTENYKHLPIIMISSRTGQKHRERAEHIGVNLYLGKPYNEQELLESIHELAKRATH